MKKSTVKYQLLRDGEYCNTVWDTFSEARIAGMDLISCGWISKFIIVPTRAIYLRVK